MNINVKFYYDKNEARLLGIDEICGIGIPDVKLYKDIRQLTQNFSLAFVEALQGLLDAYNKPVKEPEPAPQAAPADPDPEPAPTPAPEPEPKPVTMEEVRAALIEVRKTKGTDVLKACFDSVGAARLTDVDAKDYEKLLVKAKEVLNAK